MKEVPKKNTDSVLVDVKTPNFNYRRLGKIETIHLPKRVLQKQNRIPRVLLIGIGVVIIVGVLATGAFLIGLKSIKEAAKEKGERIAQNLVVSAESLKDLNPKRAKEILEKNKGEIEEVTDLIEGGTKEAVLGSIGELFPTIQSGIGLIGQVSEFNLNLLGLTENLTELQERGFEYFQINGRKLVTLLSSTRDYLKNLTDQAAEIKKATSELANISESFGKFNADLSSTYLKYVSSMHGWDGALEDIISFLDSKVDRNILLIFHNPSEIRPAGGFIGSYGTITINEGHMQSLDVGDIYWPDHEMNFERKIIPPIPLQRVTKDWGARDANWFFDFPASAKNVMSLLESSKVYKDEGVTFDAAIAINTNVLQSILEFIGPIEAYDYELVIDKDNFLEELQREVETGRDKQAGENPKKILSVITPKIMNRLISAPEEVHKALAEKISEHIQKKDIMFYFEKGRLASFLKTQGVDGGVYDLPYGFWGNYLAVVNANLAGGKSDAFIEQEIKGRIDVSNDGSSFVNLTISRTHSGEDEEDWWYKAENKNFIQVFTNSNSSLIGIKGNTERKRFEEEYDEEYETIEELKKIEDTAVYLAGDHAWTMRAFGKNVFGTWLNVPAGETKELEIKYQVLGDSNFAIGNGARYTIILERQSGVASGINIDVAAPFGYIWEESGATLYTLEREDILAREILELHLVKD